MVQADGAATTNFNAASNTQNITIAKANQTITFGALVTQTYGGSPFAVTATASSGLTVAFAAAGSWLGAFISMTWLHRDRELTTPRHDPP